VPCVVIVASRVTSFCACARPGLRPATDEQAAVARAELAGGAYCSGACCDEYCFCELPQFSGDALATCQDRAPGEPPDGTSSGWCYVEPGAGFGDPSRVEHCHETQRQLIRWMPDDALKPHELAFVACIG
jgi:hypothetical protein